MRRTATPKAFFKTLSILLLGLTACASGPTIRSHVDSSADFSRFRTFGFYQTATSGSAGYASFLSQHIQNAVTEQMKLRGYALSETPDLLVNFHLQTADKVRVQSTPTAGYYGWRRGYGYGWGSGMAYETQVDTYKEGTLNIDVVERARNQLLWEGIAVGRIRSKAMDDPEPAVKAVVAQIFERYPVQAPGAVNAAAR